MGWASANELFERVVHLALTSMSEKEMVSGIIEAFEDADADDLESCYESMREKYPQVRNCFVVREEGS